MVLLDLDLVRVAYAECKIDTVLRCMKSMDAHCTCFGVSLISGLPPNILSRETLPEADWAAIFQWKVIRILPETFVTELCVLRTFGGVDFSLIFICAQSVPEFLWDRLRASIQFPVMPKRAQYARFSEDTTCSSST